MGSALLAGCREKSDEPPAALAAFRVQDPGQPDRAVLRFSLSRRATVEWLAQLPGGSPFLLTQAGDNPRRLEAGPQTISWNFALEPGLGPGFLADVLVFARIPGVQEEPVDGQNAATIGLGNDPPAIAVETPAGEVEHLVPIRFRVADSSSDPLSIRIEVDPDGDGQGWMPARPGGLSAAEPTPEPALSGILAPPAGLELVFFWDSDFDLPDLERDVRLRFSPADPLVEGEPQVTAPLRVDNDQAPIVQLDSGTILSNPDERRGIPIPFRIVDEESDRVDVLFQWRRPGEEFPPLDADGTLTSAELEQLLADPSRREQLHVCSPYPRYARGHLLPLDARSVRLPELAASESLLRAFGLVGATLELLRPSSVPETPAWSSNPLVFPVAALPVALTTALVLDRPGPGRLREIELATGNVLREIALLGPGDPVAMALERGGRAVLVALDLAGGWRIERIELASGAVTALLDAPGEPVRGLASFGEDVLLLTVGDALMLLDYGEPASPGLHSLLTGLATPWGLALDPLVPRRVVLAEREAPRSDGSGRILAIELDSRAKLPLVASTRAMVAVGLERPEALALESGGTRLLVVTNTPDGQQLGELGLGARAGNAFFPIGSAQARIASVASGPHGARILTLPEADGLLLGGGLQQQRLIADHDARTQAIRVERDFDPAPAPGQPWRIAPMLPQGSPEGTPSVFLWDSRDAAGPVFLRALPRDTEPGPFTEVALSKEVRAPLDVEPRVLGGFPVTDNPLSAAAADLDMDGDLDLACGSRNLALFFQEAPGEFDPAPVVLDTPAGRTGWHVGAADLDGDGDEDLFSGNVDLKVFFQTAPGAFELSLTLAAASPRPIAADVDSDGDLDLISTKSSGLTVYSQDVAGSFHGEPLSLTSDLTSFPQSVVAADLDTDGDLDLASANSSSRNVTVFSQLSPGRFALDPQEVYRSEGASTPSSLVAADVDGDGRFDLVSAHRSGLILSAGPDTASLKVFLQRTGGFEAQPPILGLRPFQSPVSVAAADFDRDGDLDLVSANSDAFAGERSLTVFSQRTPNGFDPVPLELGAGDLVEPQSVLAADLDGDGGPDLACADQGGADLVLFLGARPGAFVPESLTLGGSQSNSSVVAGDVDGDGDLDLVSPRNDFLCDGLSLSLQEPPGRFATVLADLACVGYGAIGPLELADLDGDGDLDLATPEGTEAGLLVSLQSDGGEFSRSWTVLGSDCLTATDVAAGDLDGDGDLDLATAEATCDDLALFFQVEPGAFDPRALVVGGAAITGEPVALAVGDLEEDGDLDLVSANAGGRDLTAFFQTAAGRFDPIPLRLGGPSDSPVEVVLEDLDADGGMDLVSANRTSDDLTVFFSRAGRLDSSPLRLGGSGITDGPASLAVGDLDGDGSPDLAVVDLDGDDLTILLQSSPRLFRPELLSAGSHIATVVSRDLDGDGDVDLASARSGTRDLILHWGGR